MAKIIVMDAIYTAVFDKILACCQSGGYAIIDSSEFFDVIPDNENKNTENLEEALKFLQKNGCIDLKYARGNVYCVCALKNSLPEERTLPEPSSTIIEVKEKLNKKCLFLYSLSAFLGGALGGLLIMITAAVL